MAIYKLGEYTPQIHPTAFIAESADIIGNVVIKENASVWFNVTIRADNELILIGENSNIQDGAILHSGSGFPLAIGKNVTVGHMAMLHGCTIGNGTLVGIRATLLNGSVIGENTLVGACTLVTEGKSFESNTVLMGSPATVVRTIEKDEAARVARTSAFYVKNKTRFQELLERIDPA